MKATALLEKQHRKVESLFKTIESSLEGGKSGARSGPSQALEELASSFLAHSIIEEEMFYPAAKDVARDLVLESYQEHELATYALKRLLAANPENESFKAKLIVAKETIAHHVEEEEKELFPAMDKAMEEAENERLGKAMEARFKELVGEGHESLLASRKARKSNDGRSRSTAKKSESTTQSTTREHRPR